ncbi:MAG: N-acetylneuraminate synthase family protein [Lachnospiraceae bacterium]
MKKYENKKPLFIFEMANNHQGSVEHGIRIIRELKNVCEEYKDRFDFAVKFQYRDLDTFLHPDYKNRFDLKNIKRFQETRLNAEAFQKLKAAAVQSGFITVCTPFDENSVELVSAHGYDYIKIASCSFTDWPLLEKIALAGKPVIASCAGSGEEDVDKVVSFFQHRHIAFSLMHCVAEYPTRTEQLQMNQIDYLRQRYPQISVGFSTHEEPDNLIPIRIAIAKGAMIFEKHVGVPTDSITLNGYSANPEQVRAWLKAAKETYDICGIEGERYRSSQKECADLQALKRGAFAKTAIQTGDTLDAEHVFFAFPCTEGQLVAGDFSKYTTSKAGEGYKEKEAILKESTEINNQTELVYGRLSEVFAILKKSSVVIPLESKCSLSHHYGIENYEEYGVAIIDCINREYCKKILVVLPGQKHPVHYHLQKEEMFNIMYGDLNIELDGVVSTAVVGEQVLVERKAAHGFSSEGGCVFEEISTTHYLNDSYYDQEEMFSVPRKTTVYITKEMMDEISR